MLTPVILGEVVGRRSCGRSSQLEADLQRLHSHRSHARRQQALHRHRHRLHGLSLASSALPGVDLDPASP